MAEPYYQSGPVTVYNGDCIEVMRTLPDESVHAVVTDPPYGLEFMGKEWDGANGFRRSLNAADAGRDSVFGRTSKTAPEYRTRGVILGQISEGDRSKGPLPTGPGTNSRGYADHDANAFQAWCEVWAAECLRVLKPGGHMLAFGGSRTWHRLACAIEDAGFQIRDSIAWLYGQGFPKTPYILKPAFEPVVVARKPMIGTIAANVDAYGVGALNVAANRIGSDEGRRPTNVLMDEWTAEQLDAQTGELTSGLMKARTNREPRKGGTIYGADNRNIVAGDTYGDTGGASRFFPTFRYEPKASSAERPEAEGVEHPTVKPLDLMQWLVRLVTPTGGIVLEPFAGSGTTAEACMREGFECIAIEREPSYLPLILQRLARPHEQTLDLGDIA